MLKSERETAAMELLFHVWQSTRTLLLATGVTAIFVWVASAELLYIFENTEVRQTPFVDVPNSLYYVSIFLGGEWGYVDFHSLVGKAVCIFLCIGGIAIFAVPVGILFAGFEDALNHHHDIDTDGTGSENCAVVSAVKTGDR
jgi:hypothetical protein